MRWKYILGSIIVILIILLLSLFTIRYFSPRYLDDLHPNTPCDEELIRKSDYLAVIPKLNNQSISDNQEWCTYLKSFNKNLIMHGVYHTSEEFDKPRDSDYIQEGKTIFFDCFGFNTTEFKPPNLVISKENKKTLEQDFDFKVYTKFTQITHKVYHCTDSGALSNKVQAWI